MDSHDPFRHLGYKLWQKEKLGIDLTSCLQVACDTPSQSSRQEVQLCFSPHSDQRSECGVIVLQSCKSPHLGSFETPSWESRDKKPFRCGPYGEMQIILYGGRWWLPPSPGRGESCETEVACGSSQHQRCSNTKLTNLLVGQMQIQVSKKVHSSYSRLGASACPSTLSKC